MGKADQLLVATGSAIAESAAHRRAPAAMPAAPGGLQTPARLDGVTRSKTALEIPLGKLRADPDQPREEFEPEALARLAGSIGSRGVLQPIRVRWDEGQGVYVIIAGERRWRAAAQAGLATMPCVVDDRPATPAELLAVQVVENALREDLKPVEQAKAFRALMRQTGWSGNQLAKELGIAQSGVSQALALLDLPESVQSTVDKGDLPASTAALIAQLDDAESQVELTRRVGSEGLTRAEVAEVVKARKPAGAKGKVKGRKVTSRVFRKAAGCTVTFENAKGLDAAAIRAALAEVLARLDAEADDRAAAQGGSGTRRGFLSPPG